MGSILGKRAVALVLVCLMFASTVQLSAGAVYKVGDSAGWTTIGNVDYNLWAATKTFQVNDTIVFEYNPQFHNVMQVTHAEFRACNASSPISTHTTGNDSITINTHGHHFFLCGVPGHCQAGQKVDINVIRAPSVAPSPSGLVPSPVPPVTVPALSPNDAPHVMILQFGWLLLVFQLLFVFYFSFSSHEDGESPVSASAIASIEAGALIQFGSFDIG
ncbi:UNVERIFIED_CONTAM: Mavicyanin [Sesamum latifolium]|uniref:Mavicyanin n=1 Tax=Sesamum latifolium TaxID=2727402 RepID=A0AAW2XST0_9LAMI